MEYTKATIDDMEEFYDLVQNTIQEVYPKYYPEEVVRFLASSIAGRIWNVILKRNAFISFRMGSV